jgi:DNA-binding beta-propeller fold protein YncE
MKNILITLSFVIVCLNINAQRTEPAVEQVVEFNNEAKEFPTNADWLNSAGNVKLSLFKDKFLLLNFWTYSSFICLAQLNELNELQAEYPQLEIIIVHNGKYAPEIETANIRKAIVQHDIRFPVINDAEFKMWNDYGIESWPTNILINPEGKIAFRSSGSSIANGLSEILRANLEPSTQRTRQHRFEGMMMEQNILTFPSFLEAYDDLFLFVSDTRNNRILMRDGDGNLDRVIGSGISGRLDGGNTDCSFKQPRGMAFNSETNMLYIADTGNDLIRAYNVETEQLTTILGNGKRGFEVPEIISGMEQSLNQPSDLEFVGDVLYITMTGWNQIWAYNFKLNVAGPVAGTGNFGFSEGKALESDLAEPVGLTVDNEGVIYFTERQSSAIRSLDKGKVSTIIGSGVFEFGDDESNKKQTLLQGPSGITYYKGSLYVADEFNHKVKSVDPYRKRAQTIVGTGAPGLADGKAKTTLLNHPADIVVIKDKLYIADSHNHAIRIFDLDRESLSTLSFGNLDRLNLKPIDNTLIFDTDTLNLPMGSCQIEMQFLFDSEHEFFNGAPHSVHLTSEVTGEVIYTSLQKNATRFIIENDGSRTNLMADFRIFYRDKKLKENVYYKDFTLIIPYRTSLPANSSVKTSFQIPLF